MAEIALDARRRVLTKKHARFLRRSGITPANLYGAGMTSIPLQVDTKSLIQVLSTTVRNTPVTLKIHGEAQPRIAFIWTLQRDPMTEDLVHVDFYHVEATRVMHATVPIILEKIDPTLERFKKRVAQFLNAIEVECLPADLPQDVRANASKLLEINDSIAVSALTVSDKVKLLTPADTLIARVLAVIEVKEEVPEAAAAVPAEGAAAPAEGEEAAEGEEKPAGEKKPAAAEKKLAPEKKGGREKADKEG